MHLHLEFFMNLYVAWKLLCTPHSLQRFAYRIVRGGLLTLRIHLIVRYSQPTIVSYSVSQYEYINAGRV